MTRALITGLTGFVGQHLARHLLQSGAEVHGLARSATAVLPVLDPGELARCRVYVRDLAVSADLEELLTDIRPDVVYHLAGQAFVPESIKDPTGTMETNVGGTIRLFDAIRQSAREELPRIVVSGSAEIYGVVNPADCPLTELAPFNPANPYAKSKVEQLQVCQEAFKAYGLPVVYAAAFNHIGPGQSDRFVVSSFAKQLAEIAIRKSEPRLVVGNLEAQRDFTDVRDVVRAYRLLADRGEPGRLYNVCSGTAVRIREVLDRLCAVADLDVALETDPKRLRPSDLPILLGSHAALTAATGWKPTIPLDQSLEAIFKSWCSAVEREIVTAKP